MPTISTLTVDVQSRTSKFSSGLKLAIGGLAALAAGAAYAFSQFEDAENVMQQTNAVLKSTGGAAKVTAGQVGALADRLSLVSGVDDEVIQAGENMLLTFKNIRNEVGAGNDIFNQAVVATTDLAAGMAAASNGTINMKSSSIMLGKALNDPIAGMTSLTRVGVQFSEEQQKQIAQLVKHNNLLGAQKVILAEVSSQFAGSAQAQATASGKMRVAFENLMETLGGALAPAITALLQSLVKVAQFLQTNVGPAVQAVTEWFQRLWERVGPVATAIGKQLWEAITQTWSAIQDQLWPALQQLWQALKKLWDAVGPVIKVWVAIQLLWMKIALEVLPVVVAAIGFVINILGKLLDAFLTVVNWVRENFAEPIIGAIQKVIEWIGNVVGWVKDRFLGAWQAIKGPVLAVINAIIAAVQILVGWIKTAIDFLSQLGHGVGEKLGGAIGHEIPFPPPGRPIGMPALAGAPNGTTIIVNGDVLTEGQLIDKIREGLIRAEKRGARHHVSI